MSNQLVAYFSATGITAKVANRLAEAIEADVFEIGPAKKYTAEDLNWQNDQSRSSLEMADPTARPAVAAKQENMNTYDTVYVGFPIWWYVAPRIVNTFLESYDLTGKTIIPFATSGGSGMEKVNTSLKNSCLGANMKEGKLFSPDVSAKELAEWVCKQ